MAKLVKKIGDYGIYELDQKECQQHYREYPTFVAWDWRDPDAVGNMAYTKDEAGSIEEVVAWCEDH